MKLKHVPKDRAYYLKQWRLNYGLSTSEAADHFGISPSHWSMLESQRRSPSPELAARLAQEVGQPLSVILGVKGAR